MGTVLAEAGAVCLESQNHQPSVQLTVRGDVETGYRLAWPPVTPQAQRGWNDADEATEEGATGIAVLLTNREIGYMVIARSWKGTGFDYLLGNDNVLDISDTERTATAEWERVLGDDNLVVRGRMEVSGILRGGDSMVRARVNQKLEQTSRSDYLGIPAYTIVVEFGRPLAEVREG